MKCFIYQLTDPRTNEVKYVGKCVDLKVRLARHLWDTKSATRKAVWIQKLRREGVVPNIELLEECDDITWPDRERFWIAKKRAEGVKLLNLNGGGKGGWGASEETRRKMSRSHTGRRPSLATRRKLTAAKLGKPGHKCSEHLKKQISQFFKTFPRSAQHCARIGEANRRRARPVRCDTTGEVFRSVPDMASKLGVHRDSVYYAIGRRKACKGMHFSYL